jgi:ribosomal protein S18 acetylase RimI-like enzyme
VIQLIRHIVESELVECLEVIHKGYKTVADKFGLNDDNCPDSGGATLKYEKLLASYNKGKKMFAYFLDEKVVGFMEFHIVDNDTVKIGDIVVLPEYRNKGIGTELLNYSKKFCKNNGFTKLTLGMIDDNIMLKKWYIKNGFCESHTMKYPKAPFTTEYMEMIF